MNENRRCLPRMRTAEGVLGEIKKLDPDTSITIWRIRAMIRENAVPVVHCGRKKLVNVDAVLDLLVNGYEPEPAPVQFGVIRKVM